MPCSESYLVKARRAANMTPSAIRRWQETQAYKEYRRYRDKKKYNGYTSRVVNRAVRVLRGRASEGSAEKMYQFINRHRGQEGGERRFGSGRTAVSAHTAALRNWGYDPTGRFA